MSHPTFFQSRWYGVAWLLIGLIVAGLGGYPLYQQRKVQPLPIVFANAQKHWLSEWAPWLKDTRGDTEVYLLSGENSTAENSGSLLVLGGTHPDEPAGFLSTLLLLQNAQVSSGRVFVIPRANASAFSQTEPGEGHPASYPLQIKDGGTIRMPFGARLTNPLDQWPSPDVKPHYPSGQLLSSKDLRNLNRCFPGKRDGLFTEQIAAGITELITKENINLTVDLHEASLEYPVINALIAHENSQELASGALLELEMENLQYTFEMSPQKLRGLTHRELGDHTKTLPILVETANVAQGRLRGKTTVDMIVKGYDAAYLRAVASGLLKVEYPDSGIPLEVRCGRQLSCIAAYTIAWNEAHPDLPLIVTGIPTYTSLIANGF
ncbi:MAG: succinylglutamate desuccinylase/aspartoacylase family protein [bacterium]|nr:succinylglutamate desuccinylase/aspartoacylase family protein [bacterium]